MKRLPFSNLGVVVLATAAGRTASAALFDPDVYGTGQSMSQYMRQVPGGGQPGGPAYGFGMGMYEVTNAQFAAFLNDAQLDGGATGRGSNMYFQDDGRVRTAPGGPTLFRGGPQSVPHPILYDPAAPLGQRWSLRPIEGIDRSPFPVWNVSWYGAAKFSNWLTLDQGLNPGERVYTEGPNGGDWHPATINTSDWQTRDLNAAERESLVTEYLGFRLPMDDHSNGASGYNEFYKAAAWDPVAGVNHTYGFGRDVIDHRDANGAWLNPNAEFGVPDDPFEAGMDPDTTPVGLYDGTLWQRSDWNWPNQSSMFDTFQTRANANAFGIFDLSGNVEEWIQDGWENPPEQRTTRGGAYENDESLLRGLYREPHFPELSDRAVGFRVVLVPEPSAGVYLVAVILAAAPRRRRPRDRFQGSQLHASGAAVMEVYHVREDCSRRFG